MEGLACGSALASTGIGFTLAMMKPVLASAALFVASIILRVLLCKAMASGEEQDAKAEQQATNLYLHEKILGVVTAGILFAVIADKIGSTHLLGCFLAGVIATSWKSFGEIW